MKRCGGSLHKGERDLPIDKFSKDKWSKDGLQYKCKYCCRLYKQITVWARMVNISRSHDRKANRIINNDLYITKEYLQEEYKKLNGCCFWCNCKMLFGQGINRQTNGDSMQPERLDSKLAHEQKTTTLCCRDCNQQSKERHPEQMILFAKELKAKTIRHCHGSLHGDDEFDSFLPIDQFSNKSGQCKNCKKQYNALYRKKKKIEKK
jgi:hypothetical protein